MAEDLHVIETASYPRGKVVRSCGERSDGNCLKEEMTRWIFCSGGGRNMMGGWRLENEGREGREGRGSWTRRGGKEKAREGKYVMDATGRKVRVGQRE